MVLRSSSPFLFIHCHEPRILSVGCKSWLFLYVSFQHGVCTSEHLRPSSANINNTQQRRPASVNLRQNENHVWNRQCLWHASIASAGRQEQVYHQGPATQGVFRTPCPAGHRAPDGVQRGVRPRGAERATQPARAQRCVHGAGSVCGEGDGRAPQRHRVNQARVLVRDHGQGPGVCADPLPGSQPRLVEEVGTQADEPCRVSLMTPIRSPTMSFVMHDAIIVTPLLISFRRRINRFGWYSRFNVFMTLIQSHWST